MLGDFYNSGNMDIAILVEKDDLIWNPNPSDSALLTFKNNGSGSFTLKHSIAVSGGFSNLRAADFDGDQFQDVLAYGVGARFGGAEILYGNGTGAFQDSYDGPAVGVQGDYYVFRDLALSGRLDVVASAGPYTGPYDMVSLNTTTPVKGCPPPSAAKLSAKFCSPANGAHTASNSVLIKGSGNSPIGVQRMEIWIDGVKRGQRWADQIAETFTLSAGSHKVTLVAVDKYVGYSKSSINVTVP